GIQKWKHIFIHIQTCGLVTFTGKIKGRWTPATTDIKNSRGFCRSVLGEVIHEQIAGIPVTIPVNTWGHLLFQLLDAGMLLGVERNTECKKSIFFGWINKFWHKIS